MEPEVLDRLLKIGAELKPDVFPVGGEPSHVYYFRLPDGRYEKRTADPQPRKHVAADLDTLAEIAGEHESTAEIWYSRAGVTLFLDKDERRNVVTMPLDLSPQIRRLAELEQHKPAFSQAEIIRELRITFAGCLGPAGNLVEILRRVKFNATQDSDQTIQHGKSSLGKQITAQVTGAGIIPEDFVMDVPVFTSPRLAHIRQAVHVALEPDAATCRFQLIPFPGRVEAAVSMGEAAVGADIKTELGALRVPVYFGKA